MDSHRRFPATTTAPTRSPDRRSRRRGFARGRRPHVRRLVEIPWSPGRRCGSSPTSARVTS